MKTDGNEQNDRENLKLVIALSRTMQRLRRREAASLREKDLTPAQFGVLEALYHKGDLRVCDLVEKTLSTGGNMTVVIKNLEREGFLVRFRDPRDGRAFLLRLTPAGREKIEALWPGHLALLRENFCNLDCREKEQLRSLLKKLNGLVP